MKRFLYIVTAFVVFLYPHISAGNSSFCTVHEEAFIRATHSSMNGLEPKIKGKSTHIIPQSYSENIQTIVIDPGHGGKDGGTSGKSSKEKDLALQVGKRVGKLINEKFPEINVIYTRETDVFIPLHKRAEIANSAHADLFISIHCNFVPKKSGVHGTETYVMGLNRASENLDIAMRENSVIFFEEDYEENYDGYDPNSPESYIIQSMYQSAHLEHSITFANYLEHEFVQSCNRNSRGVKQNDFLVLRRTTMPSVLVELGFLSNEAEENYLISEAGQKEIASSFIKALGNYIHFLNSSRSEQKEKADLIAEKVSDKVEEQNNEIAVAQINKTEYAIQLFATTTAIPESHHAYSQFQGLIVREINGLFKYYLGSFNEISEAKNQLSQVRTQGYKDAFVTVLKN